MKNEIHSDIATDEIVKEAQIDRETFRIAKEFQTGKEIVQRLDSSLGEDLAQWQTVDRETAIRLAQNELTEQFLRKSSTLLNSVSYGELRAAYEPLPPVLVDIEPPPKQKLKAEMTSQEKSKFIRENGLAKYNELK